MLLLVLVATDEERTKFEYLYSKYKDFLFHKAWGILRDFALAEDAVSEAFIRIFRNLHKIEDVNSPRSMAFMATIVSNVALTMLKRGRHEYVDRGRDSDSDETTTEQADPLNLEDQVIAKLMSDEAYRLLDSLDEQLRNLFILKYAYDLPHSEIAAQMGITENNVTVKLHRAKRRLRELLDGGS